MQAYASDQKIIIAASPICHHSQHISKNKVDFLVNYSLRIQNYQDIVKALWLLPTGRLSTLYLGDSFRHHQLFWCMCKPNGLQDIHYYTTRRVQRNLGVLTPLSSHACLCVDRVDAYSCSPISLSFNRFSINPCKSRNLRPSLLIGWEFNFFEDVAILVNPYTFPFQ